ncbi:uncharacterized protein TrAFT101_010668 [Trichoderma asperellum]|uniref:uncharacterized protein n=1 Tax=Trichoderma asperellum TaxID=101201 RepID=UPI00331C7E2E|nr:hypothetical protein TrAFT101_010668 [Trichoderma asperellum]
MPRRYSASGRQNPSNRVTIEVFNTIARISDIVSLLLGALFTIFDSSLSDTENDVYNNVYIVFFW